MVIWLAVFYSALCEYHGLMLPFGSRHVDQMPGMHDRPPGDNPALPAHHTGMNRPKSSLAHSNSGQNVVLVQFSHVPLSAVAMSFLTIARPSSFILKPVQEQSLLIVATVSITHQNAIRFHWKDHLVFFLSRNLPNSITT